MLELYPSSLALVSAFGLVDGGVQIVSGAFLGTYVDRSELCCSSELPQLCSKHHEANVHCALCGVGLHEQCTASMQTHQTVSSDTKNMYVLPACNVLQGRAPEVCLQHVYSAKRGSSSLCFVCSNQLPFTARLSNVLDWHSLHHYCWQHQQHWCTRIAPVSGERVDCCAV